MDPALAYAVGAWSLIDTTCALLLRPTWPVDGLGRDALEPEVAVAAPRVSNGGRVYTFTLRTGFRFSDGTPVRASAFARAIHRTLAPGVASPWGVYARDIVGADRVASGKASEASGIVARGNTLVIRLKRPVPDLTFRTTSWCAVPPTLPSDREGIGAYPAAGPYYVAEHVPGVRVEIRRNRFYRGARPHHVDGFTADLRASSFDDVVDRIERGVADWGWVLPEVLLEPGRRLASRYGVNRGRFFVQPGTTTFGFVFNMTRPLFRDNPKLRQAVNFAIDRAAVRRAGGGALRSRLTDQYIPPGMPGFYGRPDLPARSTGPRPSARARAGQHARRRRRPLHRRLASTARRGAGGQAEPREDRPGRPDPRRSAADVLRTAWRPWRLRHRLSPLGARLRRPLRCSQRQLRRALHRRLQLGPARLARSQPPAERRRIAHGVPHDVAPTLRSMRSWPARLRPWSRSRS